MPAKVSVIIPTFNMEPTIGRAIDSAASQNYPDTEIVVVDDGSSDRTRSVVEEHLTGIPPRKGVYLRIGHRGKSAALNEGIRKSNGELISILDADDTLTPDSIDSRARFLEARPHLDAVFSDLNLLGNNHKVYAVKKPRHLDSQPEMMYAFLSSPTTPLTIHTIMIRRTAFDKTGYFDPRFKRGEDQEFMHRMLQACVLGYLQQPTYNYYPNRRMLRQRIKTRLSSAFYKSRFISENSEGGERLYLEFKNLAVQAAKLAYEIFLIR